VLEISVNSTALGANTVNLAGGTLSLTGVGSQPTFTSPVNILASSTIISGNNDILTGAWTCGTNVVLNVSISSGSTFSMAGGMTNFLGTVQLGNSSGFFRFNATGGSGGDTAFGGQNSTYDLGTNNATLLARNSETINLGALQGGSGTFLTGQGSSGGTGLLTWVIGSSTNNPSTTFAGTIRDNAANEVAAITKVGNGTLTLLGNNAYSGATLVSSGVLALGFNPTNGSDAGITVTTNISIAAGAILDVSVRSDGTMPLGSSQTLRGGGTIRGTLDTTGGGIVSPGGGITGAVGTLTVTNVINLGGTTWMKLNRSASPNSDRLVSSPAGVVNFGGTLIVTNIGAAMHPGDTFTLFSAGVYNNSFGTVVLPNTAYYVWNTSQLATNGSITLASIIQPAITNLDFSQLSAGTITLNAVNGAPGGSVTVLTSTNVALPLGSWTTAATGNFDGSGVFSTPVTVNPAAPQQYFILSVQ
jgi:autotransporter-associated beta strand protein